MGLFKFAVETITEPFEMLASIGEDDNAKSKLINVAVLPKLLIRCGTTAEILLEEVKELSGLERRKLSDELHEISKKLSQ